MMAALTCSLIGHRPAPRQYQLTAGAIARTWECCPRCREHHCPDVQAALLVRVVAEGQLIPAGFGVAAVNWKTGDALCLPIPLNLVAASARRAWYLVKAPHALVVDPRQAYDKGYRAGVRAGQRQRRAGGEA
ncbi:hypothetical protein [Duganella phyllosphaerae]|uniref:Uncharacterized protein n=1 Tax=Duganella phyllosphaerae TaxID=762836 RepID=A0A1E7W4N7_9BURK|nr:hypothetical protein [Duganella phyllosphaerae]OEZ90695.1 hypothetical protein DUPY_53020 [Duganella phyllosphaerae]